MKTNEGEAKRNEQSCVTIFSIYNGRRGNTSSDNEEEVGFVSVDQVGARPLLLSRYSFSRASKHKEEREHFSARTTVDINQDDKQVIISSSCLQLYAAAVVVTTNRIV